MQIFEVQSTYFLPKICVFEYRIKFFYKQIRYHNFIIVEFPFKFVY